MKLLYEYIEAVKSGRRTAGICERLAIDKHTEDLNNPNLFFDEIAARAIITFAQLDGTKLMGWQMFILASVYAWKKKTKKYEHLKPHHWPNRYKESFIFVARKNTKSFLTSRLAFYISIKWGGKKNNEAPAEIYFSAGSKDQAKIVFSQLDDARLEVDPNEEIFYRHGSRVRADTIAIPKLKATIKRLSADVPTKEGLNVVYAVIDEFHIHPNAGQKSVLTRSTSLRKNSHISTITTAGSSKRSACYDYYEQCKKILIEEKQKDIFIMIYEMDQDDDINKHENWFKSNPAMGYSIEEQNGFLELESLITDQENCLIEEEKKEFRIKKLNLWEDLEKETKFINIQDWKDSIDSTLEAVPTPDLYRQCYIGVDMALVNDFTTVSLIFPTADEYGVIDGKEYINYNYSFISEEMYNSLLEADVHWKSYKDNGWVIVTPGRLTSHSAVKAFILERVNEFDVRKIAFDPQRFAMIGNELQQYLGSDIVVGVVQTAMHMTTPLTEISRGYIERNLKHLNNPVEEWMVDNGRLIVDSMGNCRINKDVGKEKIDIISSLASGWQGVVYDRYGIDVTVL